MVPQADRADFVRMTELQSLAFPEREAERLGELGGGRNLERLHSR